MKPIGLKAADITGGLREFITDFAAPTAEIDEPRITKRITFLPDSMLDLIGEEDNLSQAAMILILPGDNKMLFSAGIGLIDKFINTVVNKPVPLKKILTSLGQAKTLKVRDGRKKLILQVLDKNRAVVVVKHKEEWEEDEG